MNFLRTLSGAFATSLVTTVWSDQATYKHAELVGLTDRDGSVGALLDQAGMPQEAVRQVLDYMLTSQSIMLSTNQIMLVIGLIFVFAASVIWLAPKPQRVVEPGAGGH
jgi:DHA2 family multidrug resistance protein